MSDDAGVIEIRSVSRKKVEANRRNAQRSTGPKTEAGKQRSRCNAVKHGILSYDLLQNYGLGIEDSKAFDELLARLHEDLGPVGVLEEELVDRIAVCFWRLRRAVQFEQGTMKLRYLTPEREWKSEGEEDSDIVLMTPCYLFLRLPESQEMDRLLRYESAIQRQLAFTLAELERRQRSRKGEHVAAPVAVQISTDQ